MENPVKTINNITEELKKKYSNQKIILFLDEIQPSKKSNQINFDMSKLETSSPEIDLLMAINPLDTQEHSRGKFQIKPPKTTNTLAKQLLQRHRNSYEIGLFLEHYKSIAEGFRSILSPIKDKSLNSDMLPKGRLPIWIQRTWTHSDCDILELIKSDYLLGQEHVTVLSEKKETTTIWCNQNGFRHIEDKFPWGIEDQVVVSINNSPGPEALSRARNGLIIVTDKG